MDEAGGEGLKISSNASPTRWVVEKERWPVGRVGHYVVIP